MLSIFNLILIKYIIKNFLKNINKSLNLVQPSAQSNFNLDPIDSYQFTGGVQISPSNSVSSALIPHN